MSQIKNSVSRRMHQMKRRKKIMSRESSATKDDWLLSKRVISYDRRILIVSSTRSTGFETNKSHFNAIWIPCYLNWAKMKFIHQLHCILKTKLTIRHREKHHTRVHWHSIDLRRETIFFVIFSNFILNCISSQIISVYLPMKQTIV